jgi:hypothetical protein
VSVGELGWRPHVHDGVARALHLERGSRVDTFRRHALSVWACSEQIIR